jgi:hypothetical protein
MPKPNPTQAVPLIKRPVEEILAAARDAGREAFVTRKVIEDHCDAVSTDWINSTIPSSLGVMDDDEFGEFISRVINAFDEGVLEYLADCTTIAVLEGELRNERFQVRFDAEMFDWIRGLFDAIRLTAEKMPSSPIRGELKRLAECGSYLAADRGEMLSRSDEAPCDGTDHA